MTSLPYLLAESTPAEVSRRLELCPALLLPIGTLEYHGEHLPLGLDGLKAEAVAREAAVRSGALVAPTSWWAADGVPRPFTLRLPADAIGPVLERGLVELASMGFTVLVLVNGHFGLENSRLMRRTALAVMAHTDAIVLPIAEYEVLLGLGDLGDHAGRWETSLLLGTRPELVHLDRIVGDGPVDGVIGADPRSGSADEGQRGLEHAGERIAAAIARALSFTATERVAFAAATEAGLAALDVLATLRSTQPRDQVPPVLTPAWAEHLRALDAGDLFAALRHAEAKRDDPSV